MLKIFITLYWFLYPTFSSSQNPVQKSKDALLNSSYDFIEERLDNATSSDSALYYNNVFINKAKKENDGLHLIDGYKTRLHLEENYALRLQYADSMILKSQTFGAEAVASALLTKGAVHYTVKKHIPALDSYLKAEALLRDLPHDALYYKTYYCIAQVKYYLGYYDEAIKLLKPNLTDFKRTEPRGYINALHLLGLCYNRIGNYALCSRVNKEGLSEASGMEESGMLPYFLHSEGVNLYFLKNYNLAMKHLESTLAFLKSKGDRPNTAVAHFYIGQIHEALGNPEAALISYEKVYEIFKSTHYIRPDLLPALAKLRDHTKKTGDLKGQLRLTNALLSADSLMHADFRYLSQKLSKEFDMLAIRQEKKALEKALSDKKDNASTTLYAALFILLGLAGYLGYRWFKIKKLLLPKNIGNTSYGSYKNGSTIIKEDSVPVLLEGLKKFEADKKYLRKEMNLAQMAKILGTNTKYVSILIHEHRSKKTPEYLNDLKIDYLVELLTNDSKAKNYTHKALATEIGYSTTNSLHKAFFNRTGMHFTEYLEGLQAKDQQDVSGFSEAGNTTGFQPGTS